MYECTYARMYVCTYVRIYVCTHVRIYADDTTVYATDESITDLLKLLETETSVVLNWFRINEMKSNDDKCHLIVANKNDVSIKS